MKEIKMGRHTAFIDDEDYGNVSKYRWCARGRQGTTHYAVCMSKSPQTGKYHIVTNMHRLIMKATEDFCVDHTNGNGLDNRKENLRLCSHQENMFNRLKRSRKTSTYKGVWQETRNGKTSWVSRIVAYGNRKYLGSFASEIDAALAYNCAAREMHGEFANVNKFKNKGALWLV